MATWLFEFDLGAGYVDKTSLVITESVDRRLEIHKDLKPTTNELNFTVGPDASFFNSLLAGGADVPIRVAKDGARFFTGFVQRIPETSIRSALGTMSIKAYDPSIKLKRELLAPYKKWNSTVSVIVGELLTAAGIASQNIGTIAMTIDSATFEIGTTYWDAIDKLLSDFGYVLWFDETGTARSFFLFPFSTTSSATFLTGAAGNIIDELKVARKGTRFGGASVSFYRHESRSNLIVFSDSTKAGQLNKCNIDLTQHNGVYFDKVGTEDVYAEYNVVENQVNREIIGTTNVSFSILGSGITVAQAVDYGLKAAIKIIGSGIITKLDIIAGSAILKGAKVLKESRISGLSEKLDIYEAPFITVDADADFLVSARRDYWANSGVTFSFKTTDVVTLGAVITLIDFTLGYNLSALVVGFNEDDLGFRRVWCEALVPYAAQLVTTSAQGVPAPNPPNGVPIVLIADITAPTVPTGLSVSQISTGALRISFNASSDTESGVAIYRVYRRENGSIAEGVVTDVNGLGSGPFNVDDTSPVKGKYYQYTVSAVDARGNESAKCVWSTAVQSVVADPPSGITGLAASAVPAGVSVAWDGNQDAIAYLLEKSTDGGVTWLTAGGWPRTINTNSYFEALAAGTDSTALANWRYKVKGISKDGVLSSSYSSVASISIPVAWTYTPAAPTISGSIAKRSASIIISVQANLVDPDGWDVQISRDNLTWYAPNLAAASDADGWYTGSAGDALTVYDNAVNIAYLPIPIFEGLPLAIGQAYYFRVRARGKSAGVGLWSVTIGAFTAFPGLFADLAAAQIQSASLADSSITTAKLFAGAVTAATLGVTNLDVDGVANVISLNASKIYSAATALVAAATGTELLSGGPASGKYAYNFFDLDAGKFRIGDGSNYIYYDGAGELTLRLSSFKVSTLVTRMKGTLNISDLGDIDTGLTNPLTLKADGAGGAKLGLGLTDIISLESSGRVSIYGPLKAPMLIGDARSIDGGIGVLSTGTSVLLGISNGVNIVKINRYSYSSFNGFIANNTEFYGICNDHEYLSADQLSLISGSLNGSIVFFTGSPAILSNGFYQAPKRMTLDKYGQLGVGANPSTVLHAYGTLTVDPSGLGINIYNEGIRIGRAANQYSIIVFGANPALASDGQPGLWWIGRHGGTGGFNFYSYDGTLDVLHLSASGNVSIGTLDSGGYKLRVNGPTRIDSYISMASVGFPPTASAGLVGTLWYGGAVRGIGTPTTITNLYVCVPTGMSTYGWVNLAGI